MVTLQEEDWFDKERFVVAFTDGLFIICCTPVYEIFFFKVITFY